MIYLDTSVALAHVLSEDKRPPDAMWKESIVSSRLFEYEFWTRLNARGLNKTHEEVARGMLTRLGLLEVIPEVVSRAREPFPVSVRTLDALHLASALFLKEQGAEVFFASYDNRLNLAAESVALSLYSLD